MTIADFLTFLVGLGLMMVFLGILWWVLTIVAHWKLFEKAGEPGWKAIIPIYNTVILFKIIGLNPWLVLVYLAAGVPFIGGIAVIAMNIIVAIKTSQAYGQESAFAIGLFLLPDIFKMILGFGSAQYVGPTPGFGGPTSGPTDQV